MKLILELDNIVFKSGAINGNDSKLPSAAPAENRVLDLVHASIATQPRTKLEHSSAT